jgi:hypothetical protein
MSRREDLEEGLELGVDQIHALKVGRGRLDLAGIENGHEAGKKMLGAGKEHVAQLVDLGRRHLAREHCMAKPATVTSV